MSGASSATIAPQLCHNRLRDSRTRGNVSGSGGVYVRSLRGCSAVPAARAYRAPRPAGCSSSGCAAQLVCGRPEHGQPPRDRSASGRIGLRSLSPSTLRQRAPQRGTRAHQRARRLGERLHRRHRAGAARHPSGAPLLDSRSGVSADRKCERHRHGAVPVDRGSVDRRRSDGALDHRPCSHRADVEGVSGRSQRRSRAPARCRGSCTPCSPDTPCARSFRASGPRSSRNIITELSPKLAAMGLVLRGVDMGKVDLPPDYRAGDGEAALRGARDREGSLHAAAQGGAGQADSSSRPRPTRCGGKRRPRPPVRSRSSPRARRRRP